MGALVKMTDTAARLARDGVFLVLGLMVGSFLTVVVHRVPKGESVVTPRSRCPRCGAEIGALENVPVLSFVALRGRCRHCGNRISGEYPMTEATAAALFLGASLVFPSAWRASLAAPFLGVMLACAIIDARHRIIPNRVVYPSLALFAAAIVAMGIGGAPVSMKGAAIGCLSFGGALFLVALVAPGGMGMGDVKLAGLIGLVLGSLGLRYVAVAAALGVLTGGTGAVLALGKGRGRKDAIPFGPYLALGAAAAVFLAPSISAWYLGRLG